MEEACFLDRSYCIILFRLEDLCDNYLEYVAVVQQGNQCATRS